MLKKKIISLITCLVMCCTFFCAGFTSHAALVVGDSTETTISYNFSKTLQEESSNTSTPIDYYSMVDSHVYDYAYFDYYYYTSKIISTSSDVYAYKIIVTPTISSYSSSQTSYCRHYFGNLDEFINVSGVYGNTFGNSSSFSCWYVNDYAINNVYAGFMTRCYSYTIEGQTYNPKIVFNGSVTYNITAYSQEDFAEEIYNELLLQSSQNEEMIALLESINESNMGIDQSCYLLYELLDRSTQEDDALSQYFSDESDTQFGKLTVLNETRVEQVDVNNMSDTVDNNLDVEIDSNYGTLLSSITSNEHILQMMLIAVSIALISYVLYGKR